MSPPLPQPSGRLLDAAHGWLAGCLTAGDLAVDATCGNGHDTLFLARQVGPAGRVWAVDIQPAAIAGARTRLLEAGSDASVHWILGDHARLEALLPAACHGRLAAVLFNLGYLPGGDHAVTTTVAGTLTALTAAGRLLRPGGALSVMAYPGHAEGGRELLAIEDWLAGSGLLLEARQEGRGGRRPSPVWLALRAGRLAAT